MPYPLAAARHKVLSALPWYLKGNIPAANCIAAYQPKGAAALAASYINLANPGTYNAAPGTAPTWDGISGWIFNGATQYLTTGIMAATGWSFICRYSDVADQDYLFGAYEGATTTIIGIGPNAGGTQIAYWNGRAISSSLPGLLNGVLGMAGATTYKNGPPIGVVTNNFAPALALYIGCLNNDGAGNLYISAKIQALAMYDTVLTDAQMLAVTNAMNGL